MLVIGLTGSIGMGKSAAADWFRHRGVGVFDADAEVHRLYAGKAAPLIEAAFPGTTARGVVDRGKLSAALAGSDAAFKCLEGIVHPLVRAEETAFLDGERAKKAAFAVLEVPLLFETGNNKKTDVTVVVSAGPEIQRQRVLARPGMTEEKFAIILARQMPDAEKRARADFVVDTSGAITDTQAQIDQILQTLAARKR